MGLLLPAAENLWGKKTLSVRVIFDIEAENVEPNHEVN